MASPESYRTPPDRRRQERLVALVLLGVAALNYPLLEIFSGGGLVFGIPLLYLYVFLVWALVIALVARTLTQSGADAPPEEKRD